MRVLPQGNLRLLRKSWEQKYNRIQSAEAGVAAAATKASDSSIYETELLVQQSAEPDAKIQKHQARIQGTFRFR